MRLVFLFFLALIAISLRDIRAKPSSTEFKVGQPFPNLVLPSLAGGKPFSLAEFRGQKVILQIFASW